MADLLVVKVKYSGALRRITIPKSPVPVFSELLLKIKENFGISTSAEVILTYLDDEGESVTMASDPDLHDAVNLQGLNPLRLNVVSADARAFTAKVVSEGTEGYDANVSMEGLRDDIAKTLKFAWKEALKQSTVDSEKFAESIDPILKVAPQKLAKEVETLVKTGLAAFLGPPFSQTAGEFLKTRSMASNSSNEEKKGQDIPNSRETSAANEKVFHTGVQCDVCGVHPISGLRYKSALKPNYDLCSECYSKHGVEGEYHEISRPLFKSRKIPAWMQRSPFEGCNPHGPCAQASGCARVVERADVQACSERELDARFVRDVSIFDGTELPPKTAFTKIWRLRNTGDVNWPASTRLAHVGEDNLNHVDSVLAVLSEEGVKPGEDVDISVDMVAPEQPGNYVSHWRLIAPDGKQFGHRVWTLIQVVPEGEPSPQVTALAVQEETAGPDRDTQTEKEQRKTDSGIAVGAVELPAEVSPQSPTTEDTSVGGFSLVERPQEAVATPPQAPQAVAVVPKEVEQGLVEEGGQGPAAAIGDEPVVVEKKGLSEEELALEGHLDLLHSMGFTDRAVNIELLRQNKFSVPATVDMLVAAAEWDPMLQDLEEMGFSDKTTNRLLMLKNKGSVKLVVKDLVQKYKQQK